MTRQRRSTVRKTARAERSDGTREGDPTAAERLFAEHGSSPLSNRQVSEPRTGQQRRGGLPLRRKADLIRAIVRKHNERVLMDHASR